MSLAHIRKIPLEDPENPNIHIVADWFSVEIFSEGKSMSNTVYPKSDADGVALNVIAEFVVMKINHLNFS